MEKTIKRLKNETAGMIIDGDDMDECTLDGLLISGNEALQIIKTWEAKSIDTIKEIREVCEDAPELGDNFNVEDAVKCSDALTNIYHICDEIVGVEATGK